MTNDEMNKILAEKVMGWTEKKEGLLAKTMYQFAQTTGWNPVESLPQAMMCLGTFSEYMIKKQGDYYKVFIEDKGGANTSGMALPQTICLAIMKVIGELK